VPRSRIE